MSLRVGELYAELSLKDQGFQSGLDKAKRGLEGTSTGLQKTQQRADQVASRMKWASAAIGAGFLYAADKASDLAEAQNVTGLVFEESRAEIDRFAEASARGLGISERAAREATATVGGLLKNLGFASDETITWSMDLTTLASDMASAFNTDPADAIHAIGAALRGETEPIRRYNVMLDDATVRQRAVEMGLARTTAEVDKNGKAQAALALLMEQTSDIQGDFANTADGAANAQRIAKAEFENAAAALGTSLAPIMAKAAGLAAGLARSFSNLSDGMQTFILVVGGLVFAIAPVAKTISALIGLYTALTAAQVANTAATAASIIPMGKLATIGATLALGIPALVAGVTALGLGLAMWFTGRAIGSVLNNLFGLNVSIEEITRSMGEAYRQGELTATTIRKLADEWKGNSGPMGEIAEAAGRMIPRLDEAKKEMVDTAYAADQARWNLAETGDEFEVLQQKTHAYARLSKKDMREWRVGVVGDLGTTGDWFEKLGTKAKVSADDISHAFEHMIDAQLNYRENWKEVRGDLGKHTDDIVQFISDKMGIEVPQVLALLADADSEMVASIKADFKEWQREARQTERVVNQTTVGIRGALYATAYTSRDVLAIFIDQVKKGIATWGDFKKAVEAGAVPKVAAFSFVPPAVDEAGDGFGNLTGGLVSIGRGLQQQGFHVGEHPSFGGVGAGHATNSFHYQGRALDINWPGANETQMLGALASTLRMQLGSQIKEMYWPGYDPVGGHSGHLHVAMYGGGRITEPVVGLGIRSGKSYSFGEFGEETVTPGRGGAGGGDTITVPVVVQGSILGVDHVVERIERGVTARRMALPSRGRV